MRTFLFALFLLALAGSALAQKRVALVIGNSAYKHTPELKNTLNDANDMGRALKALGFEVIKGLDLDKREMERTIRRFSRKLQNAKLGAFFYAGHGIQVNGANYLVPTDAELSTSDALDFEMIRLDIVQRVMENAAKTNVIFLDACRDNPLSRNLARALGTRSTRIGRGLAQMEAGLGTLISYATQPGNVAFDGGARNSPYTAALKRHIKLPGEDLTNILIRVRNDVIDTTAGKQIPWDQSALRSQLYLGKARTPYRERLRRLASNSNSIAELRTYRRLEPSLAALIDQRIRMLSVEKERSKREKDEAHRKAEAERKKREAVEAQRRAEAERKQREAVEAQRRAEAERKQREAVEVQRQAEAERKKREAAEAQRQAEADRNAERLKRVALLRDVQRQLQRLGCYAGTIDGDWGPASRTALINALGVKQASDVPLSNLLPILSKLQIDVCRKQPGPPNKLVGPAKPASLSTENLTSFDGKWTIVRKGGDCRYRAKLIVVQVKGSKVWCITSRCDGRSTATAGQVAADGSFLFKRIWRTEVITWSGNFRTRIGLWKRTGGRGERCGGSLRITKRLAR